MADLIVALALLGDVEGAPSFAEPRTRQLVRLDTIEQIEANELGWFDALVADPRWAVFHDAVVERNTALRERLHRELPELIDATVGL